ncbi:MAG: hypothetical protein JNM89_06085 [Hyphomicrobiaceae bacterium]|nr:hypothetical protein [Hyphomicrobiaceae bacterium]
MLGASRPTGHHHAPPRVGRAVMTLCYGPGDGIVIIFMIIIQADRHAVE